MISWLLTEQNINIHFAGNSGHSRDVIVIEDPPSQDAEIPEISMSTRGI